MQGESEGLLEALVARERSMLSYEVRARSLHGDVQNVLCELHERHEEGRRERCRLAEWVSWLEGHSELLGSATSLAHACQPAASSVRSGSLTGAPTARFAIVEPMAGKHARAASAATGPGMYAHVPQSPALSSLTPRSATSALAEVTTTGAGFVFGLGTGNAAVPASLTSMVSGNHSLAGAIREMGTPSVVVPSQAAPPSPASLRPLPDLRRPA